MKEAATILLASVVGIHCAAPVEPTERVEASGSDEVTAPAPLPPEQDVVTRSLEPSEPGPADGLLDPWAKALDRDLRSASWLLTRRHVLVTSTAVGEDGARYAAGTYEGTIAFGETILTSRGRHDVFVVRSEPNGVIAWARSVGSLFDESVPRVTVNDGRVSLVGLTEGEMNCGAGPLPVWETTTFFVCVFGVHGEAVAGGAFPTGSP